MTYSRAAFQLRGRPIEACSAVWEIDSSGGPLEFVAFRSDGGVSCSDALLSFFGGLPDKSVSMPASGAVEKGRVRTEPVATGKVLRLRNPAYPEGWWLVTRGVDHFPEQLLSGGLPVFEGSGESKYRGEKKDPSPVQIRNAGFKDRRKSGIRQGWITNANDPAQAEKGSNCYQGVRLDWSVPVLSHRRNAYPEKVETNWPIKSPPDLSFHPSEFV